jgi:hypothetical protein
VGVNVGVVPDVIVAGVIFADGEDFFVEDTLVEHLEKADGADFLDASGKAGARDKDEHIEGVAVVAEGGGNEAVVAGVVDGGVEVAVELEDVQLLVVLVFLGAVLGDFNDRAKDFGGTIADGKFKIIDQLHASPRGLGIRKGAGNRGFKRPPPELL